MDREEFKLRTDEIKDLVREMRYPEAVKIADSIDWKRVKNWKLLCTVGDLYKITGNLEKSRNAMLLAYDRNPSNPAIVYSLCELAIKLGDPISSVEYMKEYARLNPGDAGVFILRYKMYEEQGVSLDERAELLEQYQTYVFKPKWGYELASLYHGIGDEPRLIGECDAIFDYFAGDMSPSAHRYVLKALELKELHTVLNSAQQAYLDSARAAEQAKRDAEEAERRRIEEEARRAEEAKLAAEADRERRAEERRAAKARDGGAGYVRTDMATMEPLQSQQPLQSQADQMQQTGAFAAPDGRTMVFDPVREGQLAGGEHLDEPTQVLPQIPSEIPQMPGTSAGSVQASNAAYVPAVNPYDTTNLQQELAKNVQDVMPDNGYEPEVFTGYHPNPYEKPKTKPEKPQSGHRGAIRHKQRRYDNILSLEGDGQISLVLPEDEVIERQITGQISIDDIMERLRNYSKETQEARVEQIVRGRTDGMFNSFERQAKEGPQAELDKMLGLDRVTARDVAGQQEKKKVSLISRPAVAAVVHPEVPGVPLGLSADPKVVTPENADNAVPEEVAASTTKEQATEQVAATSVAEALHEQESADRARIETTDLNLHMGTAESAAALETANAGIGSERKATAIETADATSSPSEAATALETNDSISDSTKTAMALTNASASDITSGAAATTAGTVAAAGVMTVGAQIVAKSTGIPAYLLSGEVTVKEKEDAAREADQTAKSDIAETDGEETVAGQVSEKFEKKETGIPAYLLSKEVRPVKEETGSVKDEATEVEVKEIAIRAEESPSEKETKSVTAAGVKKSEDETDKVSEKSDDADAENATPYEEELSADAKETGGISESGKNTDEDDEEIDAAADAAVEPLEDEAEEETEATAEATAKATAEADEQEAEEADEKTDSQETAEAAPVSESVEEPDTDALHTPSETSGVSSDTAEFEAIRVINQEEVKKLSDEELSARIEAMSEAEREQYGHILHNHSILRQILMAADELSERGKFGVVVLGKDNALTLDIAKGLVRTSTKDYKSFTGKAAKIKGADLKAQKVSDFFKQLHNGALIITGAGRINKDASVALSKAMHENARFTMVILTDTDKHIRDLMNREPSLEGLFKVKVDTEIAGGDDSLVAYGKEYAREREYSIDNLGTLALHTRIEELQTFEHKATIDDVKAIVDEAIEHSSKRKFGHFVEVLSHKRYDDEDMIILREKDFLRQ